MSEQEKQRCKTCGKVLWSELEDQASYNVGEICYGLHIDTSGWAPSMTQVIPQSMPVDEDTEYIKGAGLSKPALDAIRQIVREELQQNILMNGTINEAREAKGLPQI